MKILVTGAAGFLGFHLAKKLANEASNTVICIDNGIRGAFDDAYLRLTEAPNVVRIDIDLNNLQDVMTLPDDVDMIYHLAALNGTQNFYERPFDVVKACALPTMNLLEKYGSSKSLRRFVYAGTSESYASTVTRFGWEVPTDENVPLSLDDIFNPRWSYAGSKMHGEIAAVNASAQFGTPITIIRYHNAYGPRMGDKHVVPDFYTRAKAGVFALYGYEDTRSFIYVDDAIRATIAAGEAEGTRNEIVNIGGSREITMLELGEIMMKVAGLHGEIEKHPSPKGSVKRRCPNVEKLRTLTGFEEEWSLEQGLKATADYYLA